MWSLRRLLVEWDSTVLRKLIEKGMIRCCHERDFESILSIINDGAQAYKGIIPADRWTEPYMSAEALKHEIDEGVVFWDARKAALCWA